MRIIMHSYGSFFFKFLNKSVTKTLSSHYRVFLFYHIYQCDPDPHILTKSTAAARIPFSPQHNNMNTTCQQSTTNERNSKESEGILDFLFIQSRISEKQTCFHPGAALFLHMCCFAAGFSAQSIAECLWWPLGAGAQSNPREGNGGEGFECDTNRKQALCSLPLSGAHETFIPNFSLAQAILWAYLTQCALPGAYITGTVERY